VSDVAIGGLQAALPDLTIELALETENRLHGATGYLTLPLVNNVSNNIQAIAHFDQ
jgi:hypothetical protein